MANKRRRPLEAPRTRPIRFVSRHRPLEYLAGDAVDRTDTGEHIGLVEIDWDTGTEYYSFVGIQSPSAYYDDLVTDVSPIRREVPLFGSDLSAGTATVSLFNRDRAFSIKLSSTEARGRTIRIKFVSLALGLASAITLFAGKIINYKLSNHIFSVTANDIRYDEIFGALLSQSVPLIDKLNFTGLPLYGSAGLGTTPPILAPIVMGRLNDNTTSSLYGHLTPCFLVDTAAAGNPFVYIICSRPLTTQLNTPVFYRYGVVLSPQPTLTTAVYNGHTYAAVTFLTEQRDVTRTNELEIAAWMNGITEDDGASSVPIINPVRMLEYLLDTYTSLDASTDLDTTLQTAAKTTAASQGYATEQSSAWGSASFGGVIYSMDTTWQQVIEKFCESFAMQIYATRYGKIATFVDTDDVAAAEFTVDDETDILKDSFTIDSNNEVASTLDYHFLAVPEILVTGEHGEFVECPSYRIPGEKAQIGNYDIRKNVNLPYCRNAHAATEVMRVYADYYAVRSKWIEFDLPIRWFRWADLNRYVGITHRQGISATGGYDNVTARITGMEITVQPTSAKIHIKAFKKATFTAATDNCTRTDSNSLGSGWAENETAATNLQILSNQLRMSVGAGVGVTQAIATRTETFGNNQLIRALLGSSNIGNASTYGGLFVRGSGTAASFTGYSVLISNMSGAAIIELYKCVAQALNAGTLLASAVMTGVNTRFSEGDELEIRADGTSIEVYGISPYPAHNGLILSATDSAITAGTPGVAFYSNGVGSAWHFDWNTIYARDF